MSCWWNSILLVSLVNAMLLYAHTTPCSFTCINKNTNSVIQKCSIRLSVSSKRGIQNTNSNIIINMYSTIRRPHIFYVRKLDDEFLMLSFLQNYIV